MRQLLTSHSRNRAFSTRTVRNLLKNRSVEIKNYDENNALQFQKHLRNIILDQQQKEQIMEKMIGQNYKKIVLTAPRPVESVLKQFLDKSEKYTQEQLTTVVVYLSKAYQISKMDNDGHLDRWGARLYGSQFWEHMIDQIKFGLSEYAYISLPNLTIILKQLTNMGYLDMEIVKLAISKIQGRLNISKEDRMFEKYQNDHWKRNYQMEKKNYYKSNRIGLQKQLIKSQLFNNNLKILEAKLNQVLDKRRNIDLIPKEDFDSQQQYNNVVNLLQTLNSFIKSASSMAQAILMLRKQYAKMCVISEGENVMRNPSLNHDLLQIQENLLQLNLISIHDIKNPQKILDNSENSINLEYQNVQNILKFLLEKYHILPYDTFLSYFSNNGNQQDSSASQQLIKSIRDREMTELLSALCRYVNLDNVIHCSHDKISMLNAKWQKFFVGGENVRDKLPVDRIFKKIYAQMHSFLIRNEPLIQFQVFQSSLPTKIYWYDALFQMGIYKDMFGQLANHTITPQVISEQISDKDIVVLVNLLNHIHPMLDNPQLNLNKFKISQDTHNAIMKKLQRISTQYDRLWTYRDLTGIINYIYQNNLHIGQYQSLYKKLLVNLQDQIKDVSETFDNDATLKTAQQIILLEAAGDFSSAQKLQTVFINLSNVETDRDERFQNPFLKTLKDVANKMSASKHLSQFTKKLPLILTGFNYREGCPSAIYIVQSNYSSLDSINIANGNIEAFCKRIKQKLNIEVEPISINRFLDISYYNEDEIYQPIIKMKPSSQIINIFSNYFNKENKILKSLADDLIESLLRAVEKISKTSSPTVTNKFKAKSRKIVNSLHKIIGIGQQQKNAINIQQAKIKKYQMFITFDMLLKADINSLSVQEKNAIEEELKNIGSNKNTQKQGQGINQRLQELQKQILAVLTSSKQKQQISAVNQQIQSFIGKRLTIDYIMNENKQDDIHHEAALQIMNESYYNDHNYIEYGDWKKTLEQLTVTEQVILDDNLNPSIPKLLALKYLPNVKNSIRTIPTNNNEMLTTSLPLNWQNIYLYNNNSKTDQIQRNQLAESAKDILVKQKRIQQKSEVQINELNYIIHLQNLKHELKINKTMNEVCEYILKFEFIDTLLDNHLNQKQSSNQNAHFIQRDPKQYFAYQGDKLSSAYLQSPYLEYIFSKIQKTENLKDLLNERKSYKILLQKKYETGQLTKNKYFDLVKSYDLKTIEIMKRQLNKKLIAHNHPSHTSILSHSSKLFQLQTDLQELERIVSNNNFYNVEVDQDYIENQGDLVQTLNSKRSRAQINLIMYRIIYKSAIGQQLSSKQTEFLKKWSKQKESSLKSHKHITYKKYCKIPIKKLSSHDKSHLSLQYTNFMKQTGNLALNDLVVELNNFFDEKVITQLEKHMIKNHYSQVLPANTLKSMLGTSKNKSLSYYTHKMEQNILNRSSQLDERDIQNLINMSKIFKTEGVFTRQKYNQLYKTIKDDINYINHKQPNSRLRVVAISEYLRLKDQQFYTKYNSETIRKQKQQQSAKIWASVFQKDYHSTTSPQIKKAIDQICRRIIFLKKNLPPYFSYLVLNLLAHQRTPMVCKEKLLAYIHKFKIPIQIDSQDIINLMKAKQNNRSLDEQKQELEKQLKKVSQMNNKSIAQKIMDQLL